MAQSRFVWDGWLLIAELDGLDDNAPLRRWTWGLDLAGQRGGRPGDAAGGIGGLLAVDDATVDGTAEYVYAFDAHGNVTDVVDLAPTSWGSGVRRARYDYTPYGALRTHSGAYALTNKFRFSTKTWDDESGLGYWGERYYHPGYGRWVNRDPIGEEGGANLYAYSANLPHESVDAVGLVCWYPRKGQPYLHDKYENTGAEFIRKGKGESSIEYKLSWDTKRGVGDTVSVQFFVEGAGGLNARFGRVLIGTKVMREVDYHLIIQALSSTNLTVSLRYRTDDIVVPYQEIEVWLKPVLVCCTSPDERPSNWNQWPHDCPAPPSLGGDVTPQWNRQYMGYCFEAIESYENIGEPQERITGHVYTNLVSGEVYETREALHDDGMNWAAGELLSMVESVTSNPIPRNPVRRPKLSGP